MTMPQSLLQSDDEGPVSLLSSTHFDAFIMEPDDIGDDTALSRLITNSNDSAVSQQNYWNEAFSTAKQPSIPRRDATTTQYHNVRYRGIPHRDMRERWNRHRSQFIVMGGTCLVLFSFFVWSSYTTDKWYNTDLHVEVDESSWWFWNSSHGMIVWIQSTSLLTFLKRLNHFRHDTIMVVSFLVLITTTVVLPCVTMVFLCTRMTSLISTNQSNGSNTTEHYQSKSFSFGPIFEIVIRFSYLIIYIMIWVIISNRFLSFHSSNSGSSANISFDSVIADGLVSYTVGLSLATVCALMIRSFYNITSQMYQTKVNVPSIPPDPNQSENSAESTMKSTAPPLMQILEEQAEATPLSPVLNVTKQSPLGDIDETRHHVARKIMPFWKMLFMFQCGFLSIILIVPSFYLPAIQFQYDNNGWISDMMSTKFQSISLHQIPAILYSTAKYDNGRFLDMIESYHGMSSLQKIVVFLYSIVVTSDDYGRNLVFLYNYHNNLWFQFTAILSSYATIDNVQTLLSLFTILIFLLFTTVLCPLYAIVMAVRTWMISPSLTDDSNWRTHRGGWIGRTRRQCRDNLYMIHPAVGGIVVSLSLLLSANILKHWNVYDMTELICPNLSFLDEKHCSVDVSSSLRVGAWCYILHSILLEVFILVTLKWS